MAGLFFFLNAVLPGRRARHLLPDRRAAVVVDDEVIASALARRARLAANVSQEQVMVAVSRQPDHGQRPADLRRAAEPGCRPGGCARRGARKWAPGPTPEVRINVATAGVMGA